MNEVDSVNNELQKAIDGKRHALAPAVDKMIAAFNAYKREVAEFTDLNEASNIVATKLREENDALIKRCDELETNNVELVKRNEELAKELTLYKE